jgi:hypothetical protein
MVSRVAGVIVTGRLAFALAGLIDFVSALAALAGVELAARTRAHRRRTQ